MKKILLLKILLAINLTGFAADNEFIYRNELIPPTKLTNEIVVQSLNLKFNNSNAAELCLDKKADLQVDGALIKYRVGKHGKVKNKYYRYRYSNLPDQDVLLGCKNHRFFVNLFKVIVERNDEGVLVEKLVPLDTNVEVGKVDENCHLTIDPRISINKPNMRMVINVVNNHNGTNELNLYYEKDKLNSSMSFDCALLKQE